jgi:hypothetical protein
LLLGLAKAVTLGSKSYRTHGHILPSHFRLPQLGGPGPHIYIPKEHGGPDIPPGIIMKIEWREKGHTNVISIQGIGKTLKRRQFS